MSHIHGSTIFYKVLAMIKLIFGRHRQWGHVCGSTNKKADQVMTRFAGRLAEAQQKNKRRMTAGRHGFDAWPMPSERTPVICPGKSEKRISKEQLGHASIQMTVDIYGHLIPSGDRAAVNRLDSPQMDATQAQPTKLKSP